MLMSKGEGISPGLSQWIFDNIKLFPLGHKPRATAAAMAIKRAANEAQICLVSFFFLAGLQLPPPSAGATWHAFRSCMYVYFYFCFYTAFYGYIFICRFFLTSFFRLSLASYGGKEKININVSGAYFNSVKLPASGPQTSEFPVPSSSPSAGRLHKQICSAICRPVSVCLVFLSRSYYFYFVFPYFFVSGVCVVCACRPAVVQFVNESSHH